MRKIFKNILLIYSIILLSACGLTRSVSTTEKANRSDGSDDIDFVFNQNGDMLLVSGGPIDIGSRYNKNEIPVHQVTIQPFYLDKYEVSVAEYREFCKATRRVMPKQPGWNYDNHPVVNVSWEDAQAYANWKGKRLPTELEWEYAAKSGTMKEYYYISYQGKRTLGNVADEALRMIKFHYPAVDGYNDGFVYTAPVGSFKPNKYGVFDLDGNVLEWCADWYTVPYASAKNAKSGKKIETGRYRVIRGVSWNRGRNYIRSTFRTYYPPAVQYDFVGFRCAGDYIETTIVANKN